jgi:sugar transferase EpsL
MEMKRILDCMVAALLLMIIAPVYMLIFLCVRYTIGRPVIFKQIRPGLHEKLFVLYKFRTMMNKSGVDGQPLPDELRLSAFGRFLRKFSLDEIPQLWNVIKGDISFIGPRPLLPEYLPLYSKTQARRHEVKPGITGWAQVNGRNLLSWEEKFELDVWYVDHRTIRIDLLIIWLTIRNVIIPQGISQEGSATMDKFKGSRQMEEDQ